MLVTLIEHDKNEVDCEVFLCNVEDSIKSEQNLNLMASGCSILLSNIGFQFCKEGKAVHNVTKVKVDDFKVDGK